MLMPVMLNYLIFTFLNVDNHQSDMRSAFFRNITPKIRRALPIFVGVSLGIQKMVCDEDGSSPYFVESSHVGDHLAELKRIHEEIVSEKHEQQEPQINQSTQVEQKEQTVLSWEEKDADVYQQKIPKAKPKVILSEILKPNEAYLKQGQIKPLQKFLTDRGVQIKTAESLELTEDQIPEGVFSIRNQEGNIKEYDLQSLKLKLKLDQEGFLFGIASFFTPVKKIESSEQFESLLKALKEDQYLTLTYLPSQSQFNDTIAQKSQYDSFSATKSVDLQKLKSAYKQQKDESGTAKTQFAFVDNRALANKLKLNVNKIGEKVVFCQSTPNRGMEVSSKIGNSKFTVKKVPVDKKVHAATFSYINEINYEGDMVDLLRKHQCAGDTRRILLVSYTEKRPEFDKSVRDILKKSAKMLSGDIIVVLTQNPQILTNYFQVVPEDFVTARLIDVNQTQPPLIVFPGLRTHQKNRGFYSRSVMSGPFTCENIYNFVKKGKNSSGEYYEKKKKLPTIDATLNSEIEVKQPTLVLHQKQGCMGCKLTHSYLEKIKQIYANPTEQDIVKYEINMRPDLHKVDFKRFNILNQNFKINDPQHDTTPQLFFHSPGGRKQKVDIGSIISGNPSTNEEEYHRQRMARIIEVINDKLEGVDNHYDL